MKGLKTHLELVREVKGMSETERERESPVTSIIVGMLVGLCLVGGLYAASQFLQRVSW